VDQKSGVSARLTISALENLVSNAERRTLLAGDDVIIPRICDLPHILPALTGKVELVFEGEQEGSVKVSKALVGKAVREIFRQYFPDPLKKRPRAAQAAGSAPADDPAYGRILRWFEDGNRIEVSDTMALAAYRRELEKVSGLREVARKHMPDANDTAELPSVMEFVLDGLHQHSKIAKDEIDHATSYTDMVGRIFSAQGRTLEAD